MNSDKQLQFDVEQELRSETRIHAEQIGVSVKDGVVQLDGHVDSWYEKWAAERAALRVTNAKAVACEIEVRLPSLEADTDEDIARTAMNTLDGNHSVPNSVKVQVTAGKITLSGFVESVENLDGNVILRGYVLSWKQREAAENAAWAAPGVKAVENLITVR